jgi:hypothetical protein
MDTQGLEMMVLEVAAQLVEKGWTKGALARDAEGYAVSLESDDAVCFCAIGAINRAVWWLGPQGGVWVAVIIMNDVQAVLPSHEKSLHFWNDYDAKDAAEVAAKLREAGERVWAKEA